MRSTIGVQYGEIMRTSSPGSRSAANAAKRPCMPPLTTVAAPSSAGMPLRRRTFSAIAASSSGIPDEGAYRVWLRARASPIASFTGSGVGIHGSPPSKRQTFCPTASSSMTRLRTLTISEKPTLSKRRAVPGNDSPPDTSDHLAAPGPHEEVEDHSEEGQQHDEDDPQELRAGVRAALQDRHDGDHVQDEDEQAEQSKHDVFPLSLFRASATRLLELLRDGFLLGEQLEVFAPAGLRVGPRHVEAAERMDADQGAGALAVEVEVPDVEIALAAQQPLPVPREERARQAVLGLVRDADPVLEALDLHDAQHRSEDLLARDPRARLQ